MLWINVEPESFYTKAIKVGKVSHSQILAAILQVEKYLTKDSQITFYLVRHYLDTFMFSKFYKWVKLISFH